LEHMEKTKYNPVFTKLWFEWLNSNINETAFSLNALNLGNDIVAFPCYNKDIFDKLEKGYKIECINLDLKAIEYWDQGLHCITSELDREGELEHII
jgi:N-dimethylarginine dimethylaminohydrolase